jgi:hypothetical protein
VEIVTGQILFEGFGDWHTGVYQAQISSRISRYIVRKRYVTGKVVVGHLLQLNAQ